MRKAVLVLFAFLVSAGAAWAGDDWLNHYYTTYPSGVRDYADNALLTEFKDDEAAMRAVLADKPVVVVGVIESAREATYYADPDNPDSAQGRARAIEFDAYVDGGNFVGYLFDDAAPLERLPTVVRKTSFGAKLLCEDVQPGPGGVGLQGKCRLYGLFRLWVQDANAYRNEEIGIWLRTYPSGVRRYTDTALLEEFHAKDKSEIRAALKDKPVLVVGAILGVVEETYFSNPSEAGGSQGKVPAVKFLETKNLGTFTGYLFNDPMDTSIFKKDYSVELLCSEIQRGVDGKGMQGKCKVVQAGEWYKAMNDRWEYTNKELFEWLNTPAEAKAE